MPRYFFHLAGRLPANDLIGHVCSNDAEAREQGRFIAHRVGTEKPDMVREGNFILVTNETATNFSESLLLPLRAQELLSKRQLSGMIVVFTDFE
jgi:hypothetical protein